MGKIAASQVRADEDGAGNPILPGIDEAVTTVDVGLGVVGLPAIDGSLLTNVFDKVLTTVIGNVVTNNAGNLVTRL